MFLLERGEMVVVVVVVIAKYQTWTGTTPTTATITITTGNRQGSKAGWAVMLPKDPGADKSYRVLIGQCHCLTAPTGETMPPQLGLRRQNHRRRRGPGGPGP
jgi:hypothetical protein